LERRSAGSPLGDGACDLREAGAGGDGVFFQQAEEVALARGDPVNRGVT